MSNQPDKVDQLEARVAALEAESKRMAAQLKSLEKIEVAPEHGGGEATYGSDNVMLKIPRIAQ